MELTDKYDGDSIFNKYGAYGSKYNSKSIWNTYGEFGSAYSDTSPFNKFASNPPLVIRAGKPIARLTKNVNLAGAVDPMLLAVLGFEYEPQ